MLLYKYSFIIGLILLIFACNDNRSDETIKRIRQSNLMIQEQSEISILRFEKAMVENPLKTKPWYNKAIKAQTICSNFINITNQLVGDNKLLNTKENKEKIIHNYNLIIDTLLLLIPPKNPHKSLVKDVTVNLDKHFDSLAVLMLQNDIIVNENNVLKSLLYEFGSECYFGFASDLNIHYDSSIINKSSLNFDSKYLAEQRNKFLFVDKLEYEGKEISVKNEIIYNYNFATLNFENLKTGLYKINGHISVLYDTGLKRDYPYNQTFTVSK